MTEIFGVGPIIAAMLIGYSGNPLRFATPSRYAAYTGTAPIEFSSGGRITHRLSRRGTAGSITPCTAQRSSRSLIATAPAAATTSASSPRATPRPKRSAPSLEEYGDRGVSSRCRACR